MAKTLPQMVKIEREPPEQVVRHVEPYAWQRPQAKPSQQPDPWNTPTVRLPRPEATKSKP